MCTCLYTINLCLKHLVFKTRNLHHLLLLIQNQNSINVKQNSGMENLQAFDLFQALNQICSNNMVWILSKKLQIYQETKPKGLLQAFRNSHLGELFKLQITKTFAICIITDKSSIFKKHLFQSALLMKQVLLAEIKHNQIIIHSLTLSYLHVYL